jgi:hypothetical protein
VHVAENSKIAALSTGGVAAIFISHFSGTRDFQAVNCTINRDHVDKPDTGLDK